MRRGKLVILLAGDSQNLARELFDRAVLSDVNCRGLFVQKRGRKRKANLRAALVEV